MRCYLTEPRASERCFSSTEATCLFKMFVRFLFFVCVFAVAVGCSQTSKHVMTGQPQTVPVNSTGVSTAARFALVEFNKANTEEMYAYKIVNITSARVQIVAGINYILEVQLGRTVCKRKETVDSQPCALHSDPKASSTFYTLQNAN